MTPPSVARVRREPPSFRRLTVFGSEALTSRMMRVTIGGDELCDFEMPAPAGSVRLLLPEPGSDTLTVPTWNGNEFLNEDGSRPAIRTLTPLNHRDDRLDVDVVLHGDTPLAAWAESAAAGTPIALSGPGRGYDIPESAGSFLIVGDESAIPAITQVVAAIPDTTPVVVIVEAADPSARMTVTDRDDVSVTWLDADGDDPPGTAMGQAVRDAAIADDTHVWAAGEAAAVQTIRRHLFDDRSVPRSRATVRGYWKVARTPR